MAQPEGYPTLLGLPVVSGLRLGEAVGLDREDVDARHGPVRVINSKFGKSREVPLHGSTMRALAAYGGRRDRLCPEPASDAFFLSSTGTRLLHPNIHRTFSRLKREVGLAARAARCRPRLHDLRPPFRRPYVDRLVPPRRRRPGPAARSVHLPGGTSSRATRTGTCRPRPSCSGSWPDGSSRRSSRQRDELARPHARGVLY